MAWDRKHLISVDQLDPDDVALLMERAQQYKKARLLTPLPRNGHVASLFLEPSTRTRLSFEMAAYHAGLQWTELHAADSSLQKGETLEDTVSTLAAMGIKALIIRCSETGLPARLASSSPGLAIVNAGDGTGEHPTQALGDVLTLHRQGFDVSRLKVVFVGDVGHSRVAHSLARLLIRLGSRVCFVVPGPWRVHSELWSALGELRDHLDPALLAWADVLYVLRPQRERHSNERRGRQPADDANPCVGAAALARLSPRARILHPGPVSGEELAREVLKDPRCLVKDQVFWGVWARAALLEAVTASW